MKSAYLFASILATCIFAQPLDNHEDKSPKPVRAREILGNRAPQMITTPPVDESDTIDLPVKTRQLPGGQSSGVQIDTYTDAHCKGPHLSNISLIYDSPIGYPLQSYYLHSDIGPNDKLWSYTLLSDPSAPADPSSEQKANINCALNMFNDNDVEGTAGCHSLQFKAGCIMIGDIQGEIN